jgi:hypothetical protein
VRALHIFLRPIWETMNPNLRDENNPDPMLIVETGFSRRSSGAEHQSPGVF